MLSDLQLATVRAALRYWREEMCPHGPDAAASYLVTPALTHLSESDVWALEQFFEDAAVRYIAFNGRTERIAAPRLFVSRRVARRLARGEVRVGTVILG